MLAVFFLILLVIAMPLAEGFLLAVWMKRNEPPPGDDESALDETLESLLEPPVDRADGEANEAEADKLDTNAAAERVARLIDEDSPVSPEEPLSEAPPGEEERTEPIGDSPENSEEGDTATEMPPTLDSTDVSDDVAPDDPSQGFDDSGKLLQSLSAGGIKVDEAVENMLSNNEPEIAPDLEERIELDESRTRRLETLEREAETEDDGLPDQARPDAGSESESPIDFSDETVPGISSMAVELLGEDFDFDSLAFPSDSPESPDPSDPPEEDPEEKSEEKTGQPQQPSALGDAETVGLFIPESSLPDDFFDERDVLPVFPAELIQDALVEPDRSEAARNNSFVENSRPMFVRKRKREAENGF